ncbi:MAG: sugar phosphate isomerase/epimerase [Chthonomonadales bacterium]|nr:sugar phosphate isomerase/epimerase [Chthonomonadales bacterium]
MAAIPVALQLYTVRDETARDFVGTLRKVADLGYAGVELAGTGGLAAAELRRLLGDLGLQVAGSHVGMEQLAGGLPAALDYNAELGNPWVVCPYLPEDRRGDAAAWRAVGAWFDTVGAACRERDMQFCYHNHAFEFARHDGQLGLDLLFGSSSPDLVKSELDTYWVRHGGQDPAAYIRRYAGRVPLVHLKDMAAGEQRTFAEVGEGIMDFDAIFAASTESGVAWYIVEQDVCQRPSLESAAISLRNLRQRGIA